MIICSDDIIGLSSDTKLPSLFHVISLSLPLSLSIFARFLVVCRYQSLSGWSPWQRRFGNGLVGCKLASSLTWWYYLVTLQRSACSSGPPLFAFVPAVGSHAKVTVCMHMWERFKGLVHQQIKVLSMLTHPRVVSKLFVYSVGHKKRCSAECPGRCFAHNESEWGLGHECIRAWQLKMHRISLIYKKQWCLMSLPSNLRWHVLRHINGPCGNMSGKKSSHTLD